MKYIRSIVAVPVVAAGFAFAGAAQASAADVDPDIGKAAFPVVIETEGPRMQVDDTVSEAVQAGAAAAGGAGIAMAAVWATRRRHVIQPY